jgi:hypothetical protein
VVPFRARGHGAENQLGDAADALRCEGAGSRAGAGCKDVPPGGEGGHGEIGRPLAALAARRGVPFPRQERRSVSAQRLGVGRYWRGEHK